MILVSGCMSQRWFALGALLPALLSLGLTGISVSKPSTAPRVAAVETGLPPPDTLRSSATTGTPFIRSLPGRINETPVSRYVILDGPALSGVAGRSFTWIPTDAQPNTYDVHLQALHADAPADTLVLQITLES